ncbi:MAG: hypothetical protein ACYCYK_13575 [Candidatus Dormibacteria bacterium]
MAKAFHVSRKTVRRALADPGTWEYQRRKAAPAPVMDPVAAMAAAARLRKQRGRPRRSSQVALVVEPDTAELEEPPLVEDSRAP